MDSTDTDIRLSLRERRRATTRKEIADCAADLFERQGVQATTAEAIAEAAGLSLRTFYRYCPTKEDALTSVHAECVEPLVDALAARPHGEPLAVSARAALLTSAALVSDGELRRVVRIALSEPQLTTRWLASARRTEERLTPVVAARTGTDPDALRPRLLAGLIVSAATTAMEHWATREDAGPLDAVTAEAFETAAGCLAGV